MIMIMSVCLWLRLSLELAIAAGPVDLITEPAAHAQCCAALGSQCHGVVELPVPASSASEPLFIEAGRGPRMMMKSTP